MGNVQNRILTDVPGTSQSARHVEESNRSSNDHLEALAMDV